VIARAFVLAALGAVWGCESVPPAYFDQHPDGAPGDDSGTDALGDRSELDGAACVHTDATSACCPNGTPCEGQCTAQACNRCGACDSNSYCCAKNVGSATCKNLSEPCL
jgi:hypothetical protein